MYSKPIKINKKGISSQVATVLLIGLVIALVILIMLWGKKYIEERAAKEGALAQKKFECTDLDLTVVNAYQKTGLDENQKTKSYVYLTLKNLKSRDIDKFTFRVNGLKTEVVDLKESLPGLAVLQFKLPFVEDEVRVVETVDIIPWLKVARGYYIPCSEKHINAKVGEQEEEIMPNELLEN